MHQKQMHRKPRPKEHINQLQLVWPNMSHAQKIQKLFGAIVADTSGLYATFLPWVRRDYNDNFGEHYLRTAVEDNQNHEKYTRLICVEGEIAGIVDYAICFSGRDKIANIGYFKNPQHRYPGVITKALTKLTDELLDQGISSILKIDENNKKSIAVAINAGFCEMYEKTPCVAAFEKHSKSGTMES